MAAQAHTNSPRAAADFVADVVVIGAGVVGCCVARELSRFQLDVVVLERGHDIGEGSSKSNSGIVHAGFHPRGGLFKGTSCVQGNAVFPQLCKELDVPLKTRGGMMVAFNREGVEKLHEKQANGLANGTGKLDIVDGDVARELEPRLSSRVCAALLAPTTRIVSPFELALALAQNAAANGVQFVFNACVQQIERVRGKWFLHMDDGRCARARFVVNAAGDAAALLDAQVHSGDYTVRPRLGEFLVFDKQDPARAITHVIYQAAESNEGGTLLAPTVDGNLLAGPTSRNVRDFAATATSAEGLEHVWRVAQKLIPDLDKSDIIRNFAGVRTNIVNVPKELKDFVVRVSGPGFVSTLGIKNPGLTSSPILAKRAVELLTGEGLVLQPDAGFEPKRQRWVPYMQRSVSQRKRLLAADARFSQVVCRCEKITEGDVWAILDGPLPPTTMAGAKRRLRLSMGRCQGSFCLPRLMQIMASAGACDPCQVCEGERGGRYVQRQVK